MKYSMHQSIRANRKPLYCAKRFLLYAAPLLCMLFAPASAWPGDTKMLSPQEEKLLLALSRDTLIAYLHKQTVPSLAEYALTPALQKTCGVFVTLTTIKNGELRGCIGYIEGLKPLAEEVIECTVFASTRDNRFPPMKKGEEITVSIEISVLTPPKKITGIEEIKVGEHGLIISREFKKGVLLPQVPVEQGWSRADFLKGICKKADLPDKAWEQGAELAVFSAQIFGEKQ